MSNYRKKQDQQNILATIIVGVFKTIGLIFKLIFKGLRGRKRVSLSEIHEIRRRRDYIVSMLKSDNIHELKQAVFEADKLVDHILRSYDYDGDTFADRLHNAESDIDRHLYNDIWQGHKVRNRLAHEHDHNVDQYELRNATERLLRYIKTL